MAEKKAKKLKLTKKQAKFCQEYLHTGNATESARRAGYSVKTAYSIGAENLKKPEIQDALSKEGAKNAAKFKYTLEQHIEELDRLKGLALAGGEFASAVKCEISKGRVMGFYIERKEVALDMEPRKFIFEIVKAKK